MELVETKLTHLSVIACMTYGVPRAKKVQSLSLPLNTYFRIEKLNNNHMYFSDPSIQYIKELKKKKLSIGNKNMKIPFPKVLASKTKHSLYLFKIVEKIGHRLQTGQERTHQLSTEVLMF